jgi:hypothetical protein
MVSAWRGKKQHAAQQLVHGWSLARAPLAPQQPGNTEGERQRDQARTSLKAALHDGPVLAPERSRSESRLSTRRAHAACRGRSAALTASQTHGGSVRA